jgi:predicted DNA-binding protein (MmcQ/YjbR family)
MPVYIDWVRRFCLSLPHTTEKVRWEHNLLFCIGEKMYCTANLEPGMGPSKISFKCSPEKFAELVEREGVIPAPYAARHHWVSLTEIDALRQSETQELMREAYEIVRANLPRKMQAALMESDGKARKAAPSRQAKKREARRTKIAKAKGGKKKSSRKKQTKKKRSRS